jgi:hypothetical protein
LKNKKYLKYDSRLSGFGLILRRVDKERRVTKPTVLCQRVSADLVSGLHFYFVLNKIGYFAYLSVVLVLASKRITL